MALTILGATSLLAVEACGGAAYPASPPGSVESAAAEVDRAEATVSAALGGATTGNRVHPADQPAPPPAESTPNVTHTPRAPAPAQAEPATPEDKNTQCKSACDALTSLLHAVAHLCDLTGTDDERCTAARGRGDRAEDRVSQTCPSCSP